MSEYLRKSSGDIHFRGPIWYLNDKENIFHLMPTLMLTKQFKQVKIHIGSDDCYYSLKLHSNSTINESIFNHAEYKVLRFHDFNITSLGDFVLDDITLTLNYISHGVLHGVLESHAYRTNQKILTNPNANFTIDYCHPITRVYNKLFSNWNICVDKDIQHGLILSDGAVCRTQIFSRLTATLI